MWVSLVTHCKGIAFEIVSGFESPSKVWAHLVQQYSGSGLKDRRRLMIDFYSMKMEFVEHPRKFVPRVHLMVKEIVRVDRSADPEDIHVLILSGLTSPYDAEAQMLESVSDWPTREWIERGVINKLELLQAKELAAGAEALILSRGQNRNPDSIETCVLCY